MSVPKTETRIPFGRPPESLGEIAQAADLKSVLISFLSSPIVVDRLQQYVVLVPDVALAGQVAEYHWQFQNGDTPLAETTVVGRHSFTPSGTGACTTTVELKDGSDQTLATLSLSQTVIEPNAELEALYTQADAGAPVAGHPETSRELINDLRRYIDEIAPREEDEHSTVNRLLFSITYIEVLRTPVAARAIELEAIARSLDQSGKAEFLDQAENGIGLCKIRPQILAMYLPASEGSATPLIPKRTLPAESSARISMHNELLDELENLDENTLIDLFNLLRFPKSNLQMCRLLLDELKGEYFSSESFPEIMEDREKGTALIKQYKEGPFVATP